jgi:hypothetical protein
VKCGGPLTATLFPHSGAFPHFKFVGEEGVLGGGLKIISDYFILEGSELWLGFCKGYKQTNVSDKIREEDRRKQLITCLQDSVYIILVQHNQVLNIKNF